jgi:hypothetical protein
VHRGTSKRSEQGRGSIRQRNTHTATKPRYGVAGFRSSLARRRVKQSQSSRTATFVELAPVALPVGVGHSAPVIEVTGPRGQKLTVRLPAEAVGGLDVLGLVRECWGGRG